ncbi:MAG TPA: acyltransferase family protein [Puia sp.]|uniref:acyltransferase family protein n=1 Tax=Puia sp. TaxID=2045100 RepID=UPI002BA15491|nr:acyltransferase family protein [Puia sp.]HVU95058.1 acyltransferase family protein [Puia sp.]
MKRNLQHIDELRFLIIHLILINHWSLNLFLLNVSYDHRISDIFIDLTSPILAMISGYLFFYRTRDSLRYGQKLKSRFFSLVVPYLFWAFSFFLVYILIKELYSRIFNQTFWYAAEETISFRNILDCVIHPPLKNFWYLQNLMLIAPLSIIIYYLLKNKYIYIGFVALVVCCYMFDWTSLYFSARFLPYYLVGAYFGYHEMTFPKISISKTATWLLIPILLLVGLKSSAFKDDGLFVLPIKIFVYTLYIVTLYNIFDSNQNSYFFRYLNKYKGYSFFLFAINVFLFSIVQRPLLSLGARNYLHNGLFLFLFLMVSLAAVLLIAFMIAAFLNRRFTRFYSTITGR